MNNSTLAGIWTRVLDHNLDITILMLSTGPYNRGYLFFLFKACDFTKVTPNPTAYTNVSWSNEARNWWDSKIWPSPVPRGTTLSLMQTLPIVILGKPRNLTRWLPLKKKRDDVIIVCQIARRQCTCPLWQQHHSGKAFFMWTTSRPPCWEIVAFCSNFYMHWRCLTLIEGVAILTFFCHGRGRFQPNSGRMVEIKSLLVFYPYCSRSQSRKNEYLN